MIVAGFGYRSGADLASLRDALAMASAQTRPVDALAGPRSKASLLARLAEALALPLIVLEPEALAGMATPTRSAASLAAHGTGSVAEASALVAAGAGARLLTPRHISPDRLATCALAEGFPA
ncbi:cobalamin biosynthesis protein [Sphingomonas sp. PR090111-T3T-6A]|uniref:cobalamin biosynthesis protein n=1 Tax=Sphingomonas sp. PR090111-T3T-6A TaxID=685778 RepID=UPI00037D0752|nr:cobalamin biosynthesis protein [Sphingomonas sp. PR090111-T3T-6A]